MGLVGAGKTHLAAATLRELIEGKGKRGRFTDFTALVQEIQMTFGGSGGSKELLDPLIEAEVLVLDELGAGRTSPWVRDLLYYLVNQRYLERRSTIFTTNLTDPTDTANTGNRSALDSDSHFYSTPHDGNGGVLTVGTEFLADRVSRRIRSRLFEMCQKIEIRAGDYRKHRYAHRYYEKNA
jgi:DNA replication protein DnaC